MIQARVAVNRLTHKNKLFSNNTYMYRQKHNTKCRGEVVLKLHEYQDISGATPVQLWDAITSSEHH